MTSTTEQTTEVVSRAATYGGGASAVAAWGLSLPDVAAVLGAFVAVVGLTVQVWATIRRDRREMHLHRRRMSDK